MKTQKTFNRLVGALALLLLAGPLIAQEKTSPGDTAVLRSSSGATLQADQLPAANTPGADATGLDVAGVESFDFQGDADNVVMELKIGAGNALTGISWDVTIESIPPSWCEEAAVSFSDSSGGNAIFLTPGAGIQSPCDPPQTFSSGGVVDFTNNMLPDIPVGNDGILRVEFFEVNFDDFPNAVDSIWGNAANPATVPGIGLACSNQGACNVALAGVPRVPTLSTYGLIALALVMMISAAFFARRRLGQQ